MTRRERGQSKRCSYCNGTKKVPEPRDKHLPTYDRREIICPKCKGTGEDPHKET